MMRKIILFSVLFLLCTGITYASDSWQRYNDIGDVPWIYDCIEEVNKMTGFQDARTSFFPHSKPTRAEAIVAIMRCLQFQKVNIIIESFSDISPIDYYYSYVLQAKQENLISGYEDNKFKPDNEISRQDYFTVLFRAAQKFGATMDMEKQGASFLDFENVANYAKEAVKFLQMNGIINGYGDGCLYPQKALTKAEFYRVTYDFMLFFNNLMSDKGVIR